MYTVSCGLFNWVLHVSALCMVVLQFMFVLLWCISQKCGNNLIVPRLWFLVAPWLVWLEYVKSVGSAGVSRDEFDVKVCPFIKGMQISRIRGWACVWLLLTRFTLKSSRKGLLRKFRVDRETASSEPVKPTFVVAVHTHTAMCRFSGRRSKWPEDWCWVTIFQSLPAHLHRLVCTACRNVLNWESLNDLLSATRYGCY